MATKQITARIDEDLISKVMKEIEITKKELKGGAEINFTTVLRYALELYLKKQQEDSEGIVNVKIDINKVDPDKLIELQKLTQNLTDLFSSGYEVEMIKDMFLLNEKVKYRLFELQNSK